MKIGSVTSFRNKKVATTRKKMTKNKERRSSKKKSVTVYFTVALIKLVYQRTDDVILSDFSR